eukprot:TRINITY_DN1261_c0_g1_i2.p1 TRINITY_DN1261_c0_g1~~TRINITY_DN1261_c0_g1_i2.p1  ORF type:complete len:230 (-),score=35.43 TRINITY_DN1261_c0_g1_i2:227-916(-)
MRLGRAFSNAGILRVIPILSNRLYYEYHHVVNEIEPGLLIRLSNRDLWVTGRHARADGSFAAFKYSFTDLGDRYLDYYGVVLKEDSINFRKQSLVTFILRFPQIFAVDLYNKGVALRSLFSPIRDITKIPFAVDTKSSRVFLVENQLAEAQREIQRLQNIIDQHSQRQTDTLNSDHHSTLETEEKEEAIMSSPEAEEIPCSVEERKRKPIIDSKQGSPNKKINNNSDSN